MPVDEIVFTSTQAKGKSGSDLGGQQECSIGRIAQTPQNKDLHCNVPQLGQDPSLKTLFP